VEPTSQTSSPEGRTPFDGLAPKNFFDKWPTGKLTPPKAFEAYPFADDTQRQAWLDAVELLRDLVLDYRHFVGVHKRQKVVSQTGLSTNTLSNFNGGVRFPKLSTYLALRAALPENQKTLREAQRLQALVDAQLADQETQRRITIEVEQRVRDRLRERRPGR
jgi:hypothetical protein